MMNRLKIMILAVVLLSLMIIFAEQATLDKARVDFGPEQEILRLHITANSNSLADQKIKREVKNIVIKETERLLLDNKEFINAKEKLKNNLTYLEENIKDNHDKLGVEHDIALALKKIDFPKRNYGGLTIDEGEYWALQLDLGAGKGSNWWCVLFPPFCILDAEQEDLEMLNEKKLSAEESKQVEYRFKFLDYIIEQGYLNDEFLYSPLKIKND